MPKTAVRVFSVHCARCNYLIEKWPSGGGAATYPARILERYIISAPLQRRSRGGARERLQRHCKHGRK